uniref:F-box protein At2g27310-like n=1 Tax=Tanacetum cinerariifolium TaxID=118510 RepID=A0A6L2PBU3_TANCI|nr:F-box protein At2g27310-like [Tanacetum cinerariifolium]
MATSLTDINLNIIQTHILPRLDGPSLTNTSAVSSELQSLCSDYDLWSPISKSTWPSITDPRVDNIISTFPGGHHSFYKDSFGALFTEVSHSNRSCSLSSSSQQPQPDCCLTELILVVDIRYKDDIIYSKVEVAPKSNLFASKPLPRISSCIDLKVDLFTGPDQATLSHFKESVTLNWIIIHPTLKRSGNVSSIKPVSVSKDWMTNDIVVQYTTVLPGPDSNEMVQCRISVVIGVEFHVKQVILVIQDLNSCLLDGRDFMVTVEGAIIGKHNVRRKLVDDETRLRS